MRIYVNVINKSETVPQHRQLYTISFSDTLPLTSTRSGTKLSLRLSARLSKYRRSQIVLERYVKLSMLCTFILHLIFFLFLILYPQHTPRLWEEIVVLSLLLSFLFIPVLGLAWISFFSFFTHSTLLACGRGDGGFSFLLSFTFILVLGWLGFRFSHSLPTAQSSPVGGDLCFPLFSCIVYYAAVADRHYYLAF